MTPALSSGLPADLLLDAASTAFVLLDGQLRIAGLNAAAETLFGTSRRHALGAPLAVAIPALAPSAGRFAAALQSNCGFIAREMRLSGAGAQAPGSADCIASPLLIRDAPYLLVELIALERHLHDTRIGAQQQAARELVRNLAHEIKNPLGGIRGAAQLLAAEHPDDALREYTAVIIRETDRLQRLVDRMLGPARAPRRTPLNIHEVAEHVRRLIEAEAPSITVVRDYDPSLPEIVGDREQLVQAVLNIARNALQALDGVGTITLRTRARRQFVIGGVRHRMVHQLDIEDDGPGIDPDLRDRIFYPMVSTRADGSGLGLPVAQSLIAAHGGLLEFDSEPGRTCFSIYLPPDLP